MILFSELENYISPNCKLWIYQFKKDLSEIQLLEIDSSLTEFTKNWESHGQKLEATSLIIENHFILLAVNEVIFEASGCSIDKSVAVLKNIDYKFELDLFNRLNIAIQKKKKFDFYTAMEIQKKLSQGMISTEEKFVDLSISHSDQLPQILKPIHQSWFYKTPKHV